MWHRMATMRHSMVVDVLKNICKIKMVFLILQSLIGRFFIQQSLGGILRLQYT